jgi:hypothetical protein
MSGRVSSDIFGIALLIFCIIVVGWSLSTNGVEGNNIINITPQKATALTVSTPTLQSPIYSEIDKTTSNKPMIINGVTHAIQVTFSGHGNTKGVNYMDRGKGFIIPSNTGVIHSRGHATMISTNDGKASLTFEEIGHPSGVNGTITASGSAFFDANATGNLSFLSNVVAVYKDIIFRDGTDNVTAWEWK